MALLRLWAGKVFCVSNPRRVGFSQRLLRKRCTWPTCANSWCTWARIPDRLGSQNSGLLLAH